MRLPGFINLHRCLFTYLVYTVTAAPLSSRVRRSSRWTSNDFTIRSDSALATRNDQQVAAPWLWPCSGEVGTHFRFEVAAAASSTLREHRSRHWARRTRDWSRHLSALLGRMVLDTEILTSNALSAYRQYYFKNDALHITAISNPSQLDVLSLQIPASEPDTTQLRTVFSYLQRATVFVHLIRTQNEARFRFQTNDDVHVTRALRMLEHGGTVDGRSSEGGLYPVLCRLQIALIGVDQLPHASVDMSVIPSNLRNTQDTASRHNRDYYILSNVHRLLASIRHVLTRMEHRPASQ